MGGVDGPPASAALLRSALGALSSIEIGARCTGWVEGTVAYPCGFAFREVGFTAQTVERHAWIVMDWTPPMFDRTSRQARPQIQSNAKTSRRGGCHVAAANIVCKTTKVRLRVALCTAPS